MLWGSINEDSALVTYLKSLLGKKTDNVIVRETGICLLNDENNQSWLGSSPDGIIEFDGKRKTVLEIKCPFMGGKPGFLTKMYVSTISLKSCWKCSAHPLKNVTMLFGLLLAPKFFLLREMTVTFKLPLQILESCL